MPTDRAALVALVLAFGQARLKVRGAQSQAKFLEASAELWSAEQALDEAAARLQKDSEAVHAD